MAKHCNSFGNTIFTTNNIFNMVVVLAIARSYVTYKINPSDFLLFSTHKIMTQAVSNRETPIATTMKMPPIYN